MLYVATTLMASASWLPRSWLPRSWLPPHGFHGHGFHGHDISPAEAAGGPPAGVGSEGLSRVIRLGTDRRANRANVAANSAREDCMASCSRAAASPMASRVGTEAPGRAVMSLASA